MSQGIEDGYLAACEIVRRDIFLDDKPRNERETGIEQADLQDKVVRNADTGEVVGWVQANPRYEASSFEDRLLLPERVAEMARDLFAHLLATGGPEQKTIVFCARDRHADDVASALNNLYARWCAAEGRARLDPYAFKCTASVDGAGSLPDLRGASRHHFIATTVELLTTGVDVPCVRNIVFFKYVRSPIAFYQMVGRGTRIDPPTGKLMFRVYDYTDATRLFGEEFKSRFTPARKPAAGPGPEAPAAPAERTLLVEGFDVRVTDAGRYIVTQVDGKAMPVTVEEYKERLAARLVEEVPTLDAFRARWINFPRRWRPLGVPRPRPRRHGRLRPLRRARRAGLWPGSTNPSSACRGIHLQAAGLAGRASAAHVGHASGPGGAVRPSRHRRPRESRGLPDPRRDPRRRPRRTEGAGEAGRHPARDQGATLRGVKDRRDVAGSEPVGMLSCGAAGGRSRAWWRGAMK
ncbi:MAG: hypothetical protein HYY95_11240 [Candidatus Rokubacteria bacterium]|nr:hypothetical protein [Candidatus Rokubacteria bacterium]